MFITALFTRSREKEAKKLSWVLCHLEQHQFHLNIVREQLKIIKIQKAKMNLKIFIVTFFVCLTLAKFSSTEEVREGRDSPSAAIASYITNYQLKHKHKKFIQTIEDSVDEERSSPVGSIGGYITSYWEKKKHKKNKTKSPKHPSNIKKRKPCFYYNY